MLPFSTLQCSLFAEGTGYIRRGSPDQLRVHFQPVGSYLQTCWTTVPIAWCEQIPDLLTVWLWVLKKKSSSAEQVHWVICGIPTASNNADLFIHWQGRVQKLPKALSLIYWRRLKAGKWISVYFSNQHHLCYWIKFWFDICCAHTDGLAFL